MTDNKKEMERDEFKAMQEKGEATDIIDDIVFEIELLKQIEINIDYILLLVKKYHDGHCKDEEIKMSIQSAVNSSPELRSKKMLIENFIAGINEVDDIMAEWRAYVERALESDLAAIIAEEKLKEAETRKFIENAFRDGEIKTVGTDIVKIMPAVSMFGKKKAEEVKDSGNAEGGKKARVIAKLKAFFEKFFGVGVVFIAKKENLVDMSDADNIIKLAQSVGDIDVKFAADKNKCKK